MIYRKIGLYILSLWLLFLFLIIIKIDVPIYFGKDWQFVGCWLLIKTNPVPTISLIFMLIGYFSYRDFKFQINGAREIPFEITKIESLDHENLVFLATYIIPLVCFDLKEPRYTIVLLLLLVVMGLFYIKTDLFYNNPSLSFFNFKIYKVEGNFQGNEHRENIVLISQDKLVNKQKVVYMRLDDRVYYATGVSYDKR